MAYSRKMLDLLVGRPHPQAHGEQDQDEKEVAHYVEGLGGRDYHAGAGGDDDVKCAEDRVSNSASWWPREHYVAVEICQKSPQAQKTRAKFCPAIGGDGFGTYHKYTTPTSPKKDARLYRGIRYCRSRAWYQGLVSRSQQIDVSSKPGDATCDGRWPYVYARLAMFPCDIDAHGKKYDRENTSTQVRTITSSDAGGVSASKLA